ncbi:MAG: thioesterase II family protein [Aeoliella sp.]
MLPTDLLPQSLATSASRRLFCFPHAGGGTALYYRWQRHLPNDLVLAPMRLPGREDRIAEPPYSDLVTLASDAAIAIRAAGNLPFALVGHSLGAYVALEVALRLASDGGPLPAKLIVAACGAPRIGKPTSPIGKLPDDEFIDQVAKRYDGIPAAVRNDAELLAMVLPALRADIQMIESYDYQPVDPLPIDLVALGGADDPGVAIHRLAQWREHTTASFTMRLFPGGHFFLHPPARRAAPGERESIPAPLAAILEILPPNETTA